MFVLSAILIVFLLIQWGFAFGYFMKLANAGLYQPFPKAKSVLTVSVILVAHNEEHHLKKLVPAILAQDYPDFELLIVLDRCTDQSENFLRSLQDGRLRILTQEEVKTWHPKKAGVQKAVEAARGSFLLLTDADCRPASKGWIASMAAVHASGKDIVIGYSPYEVASGFLNQVIQYETLHTALQYLSFAVRNEGYMAVGRNWGYSKQLFQQTGFGETAGITGGDDDLLFQRMSRTCNYGVCLDPASYMISSPPDTWSWWFRQKIRHLSVGKSYSWAKSWKVILYQNTWALYLPLVLILMNVNFLVGISFFLLRILAFAAIFHLIARRLMSKWYLFNYILLDIFYNICYFILALAVLKSKKIQWK